MKAIIMAGGEGKRLRPITSGRPKPMTELLGKPACEYTVELLKKYGFTDICFTLRYMPEKITDYFGDGEKFGVNIQYNIEKEPLGTAGGVRQCLDFLGEDDALIISGDSICDFKLDNITESFYRNNAEALIVLYEHHEPTEYGLVITEKDGRVIGFSEKPSWDKVTTNRINTGIYVLKNSIICSIPQGKEWDFGKNVFPNLLSENKRVYSCCAEGYWCDIGSPEAYRQCCIDIISGKVNIKINAPEVENGIYSLSKISDGVSITPPVYIGKDCEIEAETSIRCSVIGDKSTIKMGNEIENSVLNRCKVGNNTQIIDSVVCENTEIGDEARILENCVIGDNVSIGDRSKILKDVRIYSDVKIKSGETVRRDIRKLNDKWEFKLSKSGSVVGKYYDEITIGLSETWGITMGDMGRIGVSQTGGDSARILASAFQLGVNSAGGEVFEIDAPFESALSYEAEALSLGGAAFFREEDENIIVTFMERNGVFAGRELERKLSQSRTTDDAESENIGGKNAVTGAGRAYVAAAAKSIGEISGEIELSVCGRGAENRALRQTLAMLGGKILSKNSNILQFCAEKGGFGLNARDEDGFEYNWDKLRAAALYCAIKGGHYGFVALPEDSPEIFESIAEAIGGKAKREENSQRLFSQRFMVDGLFAASIISAYLIKNEMSFCELMKKIPEFSSESRSVKVNMSCAEAMRKLTAACSAEMSAELGADLRVCGGNASAHISPTKDGSSIFVRSEAENKKEAEELLSKIADIAENLK